MKLNDNIGPYNEKVFRTDPGYPSLVQNISVLKIKNDSVDIIWNEPEFWNGPSKSYKISLVDIDSNIEVNQFESNIPQKQISSLKSYTNYSLKIVACNLKCGSDNEIRFQTLTGTPGSVTNLNEHVQHTNHFKWHDPVIKSAKSISFYEYEIQFESNCLRGATNTTELNLGTDFCRTKNIQTLYTISVRAVNIINSANEFVQSNSDIQNSNNCSRSSNEIMDQCNNPSNCLKGDWIEKQISCTYQNSFQTVLIILIVLTASIVIIYYTILKIRTCMNVPMAELPFNLNTMYHDNHNSDIIGNEVNNKKFSKNGRAKSIRSKKSKNITIRTTPFELPPAENAVLLA